jgi:hypothetical protein
MTVFVSRCSCLGSRWQAASGGGSQREGKHRHDQKSILSARLCRDLSRGWLRLDRAQVQTCLSLVSPPRVQDDLLGP